MIVEDDEPFAPGRKEENAQQDDDDDFDFEYRGDEEAAIASSLTQSQVKTATTMRNANSPTPSASTASVTTVSTPPPSSIPAPPISRTATPGSAARRWSERFVQKNPRPLGICSVHVSTLFGRHEEEGPWHSCVINPNQSLTRLGPTKETFQGVLEFMDALEQEHAEEGATSSFIDRSSEATRDPFGYFMSNVNSGSGFIARASARAREEDEADDRDEEENRDDVGGGGEAVPQGNSVWL